MVDYLVVGLGLAGVSFCERLEENNKSYKVISDHSQVASLVAAGLYNPVVLKRFTLAWNAKEQLDKAIPFYKKLESKLNTKLDYKLSVMRRFASIEEQNLWFEASTKEGLNQFLSTKIHKNTNSKIDAPFGLGKVLDTGRIDTEQLLKFYSTYLKDKNLLLQQPFRYGNLQIHEEHIKYDSIKARYIIFTEGFGLQQNPYFNYLPLNGNKGEYVIINAPDLQEKNAIKSNIFCIPEGDDIYRVGATYKWKDKTNEPTEATKNELLKKLESFIKCDYEVVGHVAGIRPTVVDRRPLVGQHPHHEQLFILNGFGSRGVLIAPFASECLYNLIENELPVHSEMDIVRFQSKYFTI